jgi:hypothetical protein
MKKQEKKDRGKGKESYAMTERDKNKGRTEQDKSKDNNPLIRSDHCRVSR